MDYRKKLTCKAAREIDLVEYLSALGFEPAKIRGHQFWYFSPFRNERTPSFKIDRNRNRWFDFGEGIGGSIIDFAIRYSGFTIAEFLKSLELNDSYTFMTPPENIIQSKPEPSIVVQNVRPIFSSYLLEYLEERRISIDLADRYLKEIQYTNIGKGFYGLGFSNDKGGWEIRSRYFKGSSTPKFYTHFKSANSILCVFEGFMDFLSFLLMHQGQDIGSDYDCLILNSLSFVTLTIPIMATYNSVYLYLDNDKAGDKHTLIIKSEILQASDQRVLYKNYKDLNEFLCFPSIGTFKPP